MLVTSHAPAQQAGPAVLVSHGMQIAATVQIGIEPAGRPPSSLEREQS
jgi:hypothetical protein